MWCDDFDIDLYRVMPELREVLALAEGVKLYTHGHTTDGKLNHPTCWNDYEGSVCFFGFDPRTIGKPESYWTDSPVVECTWPEVVRDLWCHHLVMILCGVKFWDARGLIGAFNAIMYDERGWSDVPTDATMARALATASIREATYDIIYAHGRDAETYR